MRINLTGKARKSSNANVESLDAYDIDEDGFIEGDLNIGKPIASFSFGSNTGMVNNIKATEQQFVSNKPGGILKNDNMTFKPSSRGLTPPIDGEQFTIKRCYQFRPSTVRKLNELKAKHPDVNAYLNSILDEAISYYYDHIFKENGSFK
jgi:hypothetical protein